MTTENYNPYYYMLGQGAGNIFGGFMGRNMPNPANSAMPYFNNLQNMLPQYYSPFISAGMNATQPYLQGGQYAGGQLQQQIGNLLNNPTGVFNQWGSTYQASPGYNWQTGQALNAANNAAAAGGMAGSQAEQQNIASTVNQLANQDYWQYLNNAQNLFGQGMGAAQNMYGIGANTANNMYNTAAQMSGQLGENLASGLMNQGNLAYAGQINQNTQNQGAWGQIASGLGGLFGGAGGLGGFGSLGNLLGNFL